MLATAFVILFALALCAASESDATRQEAPAFNLSEHKEIVGTEECNNSARESAPLQASIQLPNRTSKVTDSERLICQALICTQLHCNSQPFNPDLFITNSDLATTAVSSGPDRILWAAAAAVPQIAFATLVSMSPFYQTAITNLVNRITMTPTIYLCLLSITFVIVTSLPSLHASFAVSAKHAKSPYYLRQKRIFAISGFFITAFLLALFNSSNFAQAGESGTANFSNAVVMLGLEIGLTMLLHPILTGMAEFSISATAN